MIGVCEAVTVECMPVHIALPSLGSKPPGTEAIFHIITANLPDELSELKEFLSTV